MPVSYIFLCKNRLFALHQCMSDDASGQLVNGSRKGCVVPGRLLSSG